MDKSNKVERKPVPIIIGEKPFKLKITSAFNPPPDGIIYYLNDAGEYVEGTWKDGFRKKYRGCRHW